MFIIGVDLEPDIAERLISDYVIQMYIFIIIISNRRIVVLFLLVFYFIVI